MDLKRLPSSTKNIDLNSIHYYRNESGIIHTKKYNETITEKGKIVDTEIIGNTPRFGVKQHSKSDTLYYTKRELSTVGGYNIFRSNEAVLEDAEKALFCYVHLPELVKLKKQIIDFGLGFFGSSLDVWSNDSSTVCTSVRYQKSSFIREPDGSYTIPDYQNGMSRKHRTIFIMGEEAPINIIEIDEWLLISCRTEDDKIILSFDYMYEKNWKSPKLNIGSCYDWEYSNHLAELYRKSK